VILALFAFPIVSKKNDRSTCITLVKITSRNGNPETGKPSSYWTNLGLEAAETKAQQLTGKIQPGRWDLVATTGSLDQHAVDQQSGQLAFYLARVALDRNTAHMPYGTRVPIWATGSIDENGLRPDMQPAEGALKLQAFMKDANAHLLFAPAKLVDDSREMLQEPPLSIADFSLQRQSSNFWTDHKHVVVKVEQNELVGCADCLLPPADHPATQKLGNRSTRRLLTNQ
jgi:hypothetical protein